MMTRVLTGSACLLCLILAGSVLAGDIGDEIRGSSPGSENGGFLELGLTAIVERRIDETYEAEDSDDFELGLGVAISAGYRYEGLFIEASESGFDGLNLGATVYENDRWSVDLLLANIAGNVTVESDEPPAPVTEDERNRALVDRDSLYVAAGARVTAYHGDNILQFRLVSDWYDDNGLLGSARVGRQWQLGNWNMQAVVGARFYSQRFNNYLYGVTAEEQSVRFPEYRAGSAVIPEVEIGASMPISQNWIYNARLRGRVYPDSVTDSPLVSGSGDAILITGIHYVF